MKFPCTQHQGQYLYVFVQLAHRAACLSLEWEPAERWSSSGESSAAPDTAERLQEEILPLGYWNFIIPDQTDDLKDLVRINYISGKKKKGSELAPGDGKTMAKGAGLNSATSSHFFLMWKAPETESPGQASQRSWDLRWDLSNKREPVWNDLRKELSGRGKNCKGPETGWSSECPGNNRRPVELGQSEQHRVRPDLRSKTMQAPWVLFSNPWFIQYWRARSTGRTWPE